MASPLDKLKKLLETGKSSVRDVFDANTADDQKRRIAQGKPAQYSGVNMASPVSAVTSVAKRALPDTSFNNPASVAFGISKKIAPAPVTDFFDGNTEADQIRRAKGEEREVNYNPLAFGKSIGQNKKTYAPTPTPYRIPTSYEDEQAMNGNKRPFTNLGQQLVGNTARVLNTAYQNNTRTVPQAIAGITLKGANRAGILDDRGYRNAVNNVLSDKKVYGGYTPKGGVLNAGTVIDSPEQAKNLTTRDVVQKSVGYGLGTYGELSPIGAKGGLTGRTLLGATEGAIGDAGSQLVNTGRIDPKQTLASAGFGGVLSNVAPVTSKLIGRNTPTPRTPDARLNDADVSGLLKIKNGRGDFMDDVEYTKALESVRKAGIDITKPEAWSQIDGVLARYNQVLEGRGDPSMFDMGQSRFKPTPLNQGGYIKNPLAKDPLESLKQEARKYGSADEFVNKEWYGQMEKNIAKKATDSPYASVRKYADNWTRGGKTINPNDFQRLLDKDVFPDAKSIRRATEADAIDGVYSPQSRIIELKDGTKILTDVSPSGSKLVLTEFAVEGNSRNKGIGTAYVNKLKEIADDMGVDIEVGRITGTADPFWRKTLDPTGSSEYTTIRKYKAKDNASQTKQQLTDLYNQATQSQPPKSPLANDAPQVGKTLKETRTNTAGIKNYNPDGLPGPANRIVHDLGKYYESLGSRQGVDINHDTGVRVSNNSPAYRELFADLGRTPRSKDWYDYAYRQINDGTAPKEITDQFEKTLNFELSTDKTIQAPEALNPQGSTPIKNKPSDMPTSDWESLIRSRVPDQTKVDVVNNGGRLEIQKKTVAPITRQETVQQTIPTEVTPQIKTAPAKDFTDASNRYLGTLESADTTARQLADDLPVKLKGQDAIDAIIARENGVQTGRQDIDSVNAQLQRTYDNLYAQYKDAGFDMGYVDDYSPRIYKSPEDGSAITKDEYLYLTRTPGRTISRTAENVKPEDLLYKTPQELLAHYVKTFEKAKAGREYIDTMKKQGYIVESGTRPDGMMVIDAPGMPQPSVRNIDGVDYRGNYYATPKVAKQLNKIFGVNEGNAITKFTAGVASKAQDIGLSGGIPGTPVNAFTFAQATKEFTAGKFATPIKALFNSRSANAAQDYFKKNASVMSEMQKNGIRLTTEYNTQTLGDLSSQIKQADGTGKAGVVWDKAMSDPTFKRFMPSLQVETYKQIKNKYVGKLGEEKASELASSVVKNFYGLTDLSGQATRSATGNDVATTLLFAPKYRESMVKFWVNNVKAIDPRNAVKPEYAMNVRFNAGATLLFGAMQAANMYLNGTPTWENPDGKKDKLIIPASKIPGNLTGGKDLGIPFLSSIATIPRAIGGAVAGVASGNPKEVGKAGKSMLSYAVRPFADIADNENYFGSRIYDPKASTGEKLGSQASYLFKAFQHPYVREGLNVVSSKLPEDVKKFTGAKEQSPFQTTSQALESPLRFYDPTYYRGGGDNFQANEVAMTKDQKELLSSLPKEKQEAYKESLRAGQVKENGQVKSTAPSGLSKTESNKLDKISANNAQRKTDGEALGISEQSIKTIAKYDRLSNDGKARLKNDPTEYLKLKEAELEWGVAKGTLTDRAIASRTSEIRRLKGIKDTKTASKSSGKSSKGRKFTPPSTDYRKTTGASTYAALAKLLASSKT